MDNTKFKFPHIGLRIIKSALGVFICFMIYLIRGKHGIPFYSALAVLWCIQNQTHNTMVNALQRMTGTFIGAMFGLVFLLIKMNLINLGDGLAHYGAISILLIAIIYFTVVIKQKKASYFSCVVFLSIVVNHLTDVNPYIFVADRSLDTLIGIFVGVLVNSIHFHGIIDRETLYIADIDKAIDSKGGEMTAFSRVSINKMLEDGIKLTFMTNKTPAGFLEKMSDIKPTIPIIAMNGAILYDVIENNYPKVYVISGNRANIIERFITEKGFNLFTTVILEDVLIIYYNELQNPAESDIYSKMHKSPYRNYLNKERPKEHPVVYMMCIDKSNKIEELLDSIRSAGVDEELKILTYPSDNYPGYSYMKIYNHNASIENMEDYLLKKYGTRAKVTLGDNNRNIPDYCYDECNQMIRKLSRLFYWKHVNHI